jgi:hypothetical protein
LYLAVAIWLAGRTAGRASLRPRRHCPCRGRCGLLPQSAARGCKPERRGSSGMQETRGCRSGSSAAVTDVHPPGAGR